MFPFYHWGDLRAKGGSLSRTSEQQIRLLFLYTLWFLSLILLLTSFPTGNKIFTETDLSSAFFSILVHEACQYFFFFFFFAFSWKKNNSPGLRTLISYWPEGWSVWYRVPWGSYFVAIYRSCASLLSFPDLFIGRLPPFAEAWSLKGTQSHQRKTANLGSVFMASDIRTSATPRCRQTSPCPKFHKTRNEVATARLSWAGWLLPKSYSRFLSPVPISAGFTKQ